MAIATYGLGNIFHSELVELAEQVAIDVSGECWATVNEARVSLYQSGAGRNHVPCVLAGEDTANADDWNLSSQSLKQKTDDFQASRPQRGARKSSGTDLLDSISRSLQAGARKCRVRGDQTRELEFASQLDNFL